MYSKETNETWFLKSLVMSKCESRTSLHAVRSVLETADLDTLCVNRHFGVNSLFTV